ncbi:MAG: hypothetical protein GY760_25845 [Deltaproteobacteria bacterium]|nr:hypothetical protein [Deltaproteobacteria bacterium]
MVNEAFEKLITCLETRGLMYITPFNYSNLISYIFGYDRALCDNEKSTVLDGFKELITAKYGSHSCIHWAYIIPEFLAENDEEAIKLFFTFYHELVIIKKTKGIQFLKNEYERIGNFKRKRKTNIKWPIKLKR